MFTNILIGVDGQQGGRDAIAVAKQLAGPGSETTLAYVCGAGPVAGRSALLLSVELEEAGRILEQQRDRTGVNAELVTTADRSAGRGLQQLALKRGADLLVVGSCHRGLLGRVLLGDDASEALNGAPCAVAIAPTGYAGGVARLARIGVGFDGSSESHQAITVGRQLASECGSVIRALSVVSIQNIPYGEPISQNWPDVAKRLLDAAGRELDELVGIDGDTTYGDPSEELAAFSEDLDLLIVGSRSYGPIGRLFSGSTSNRLARHARCPLLVLPRSAGARAQIADEPVANMADGPRP